MSDKYLDTLNSTFQVNIKMCYFVNRNHILLPGAHTCRSNCKCTPVYIQIADRFIGLTVVTFAILHYYSCTVVFNVYYSLFVTRIIILYTSLVSCY